MTASQTGIAADDEVIELEPKTARTHPAGRAPVGLVRGGAESLASQLDSLRRARLGASAAFLTVFFGVLTLWNLFTRESALWFAAPPMSLRFLLALVVAVLCFSRVRLTPLAVKAIELGLFGGLTVLLCLTQYFLNLELIARGHLLGAVSYTKNGIIQLSVLMVLYGMLIPNTAKSAATVVLSMALALATTFAILVGHEATGPIYDQLNRAEPLADDLVYILAVASLSIYGAHILNGLRTELHGARKFGQYQLGEKIGTGGMGEVFLAEHQLLKRPCALKLIRRTSNSDPVALARFEREVRSAARLSHPNTVGIYDYGHTDDGTFYYVMEYLPGLSLEELVGRFGPLPAGRLIHLLRQVCAGLAEAHGLGLVHRDLKPANVFVALRGGEYDVSKVLDFGLVKLAHDPDAPHLTGEQTVSGTPFYMSPEQAKGAPDLDHRTDIYSLGAVAYYALSGQPPFTGDSAMSVMIAHARDPVVPLSQLRADVPADLNEVVLKCLSKNPADRFQDVKSLSAALARCAAHADWDDTSAEAWWVDAARIASSQSAS
jgi:serine/threonine-protein kinase